jgi:hypothetical protein
VEPAAAVRFVRPFCGLTHHALLKMARDEGIAVVPAVVEHPDAELHRMMDEFVRSKKGNLLEKLKNVSNAGHHVNKGYLA